MQADRHSQRRRSSPVIAANMPFVALYPSARLALWGIRYWAACARAGRCAALLLRDVFVSAGVPLAPASVDRMMQIITTASRHPPALGCPACTHLTDDEASLLRAMMCTQAGDAVALEQVLSAWLPWHAAEAAADCLSSYARLLKDGGYDLSSNRVPEVTHPPVGARLH